MSLLGGSTDLGWAHSQIRGKYKQTGDWAEDRDVGKARFVEDDGKQKFEFDLSCDGKLLEAVEKRSAMTWLLFENSHCCDYEIDCGEVRMEMTS